MQQNLASSKGYLEISASHRHWNRYWHQHCKNFIFAFWSFFWKNRAFLFIPFLSSGISTILLQILISLRFPIKPPKGVNWCSRKKLFEFSEAYVHWCFEKITARKIPAYFLAKNPGWSPFQYTRRFSWNFS